MHESTKRDIKPSLTKETPEGLVKRLSHPNGWYRDTAQRLLVERGATSVAPTLKQLALTSPDYRTRLHALWTLDGLGEIDAATVEKALADKSVDVRASAVRLSERWLGEPASPLSAIVVKLGDDPNWMVRRQVAASLGMLPQASRVRPLVSMLEKYGADPITVDAATSGLAGLENEVLGLLLQGTATTPASAGRAPRPDPPIRLMMPSRRSPQRLHAAGTPRQRRNSL